jgi:hypothetical protein
MESRMRNGQDWGGSFGRFAAIAVAFLLAVAIARGGPWNIPYVPPNPGPSAMGPSQTTTGMAR